MLEPRPRAKLARVVFAVLASGWSVLPIALVVLASFKPPRDIFAIPPTLIFTPTLENYARLWELWPGFFDNMRNSLIITAGATALVILASTMAGVA